MQNEQKIIVDIPLRTILKVFLTALGILLLYLLKDVILLFIFVLIFFSVLNPIVTKWEEEMSRRAAIASLFFIILLFIIAAGLLIVPPLVTQFQSFINNIPDYLKSIPTLNANPAFKELQKSVFSLSGQIGKFGLTIFNTTVGFFGGLVAIFTVLVSTFYLLSEKNNAAKFVKNLNFNHKEAYYKLFERIGEKLGLWMRGQLLLMLIVGALDFTGLLILGIPYALTLGVWAGLTEIIPYVGPILGAIPAVLIAISLGPVKALLVVAVFVIVQQIEAQFLVPRIMSRAIGLSPVIIIFSILIFGKLFGLVGVLLAVPIAATLGVFFHEYPEIFQKKAE